MFAQTSIINPFPIPVWIHLVEAEQAARINEAALKLVAEAKAAMPPMQPTQQWQTPNDLQTRPELEELNGLVEVATRGILTQLGVEYGSFMITGCWANILPKGSQPHPRHTHPNNYLSGVYYVQVPKGGEGIVFHDPKPQTNVIAPRVGKPNAFNSRRATLPVQPGMLIMFPSWLAHSVPGHDGERERVSVSFNVMFTQFAEELSKPRWTFEAPSLEDAEQGS